MKFNIPSVLEKSEFIIFGAGETASSLESYLKSAHQEVFSNLKFYIDDRAKDIAPEDFSRQILLPEEVNTDSDIKYIAVCTRFPVDRGKIAGKITELYAGKFEILDITPEFPDVYPISENVWDYLDSKLIVTDCGAIGGDSKTGRIIDEISEDKVLIYGFDPNEEACEKQTKGNVVCSPFLVSDAVGTSSFYMADDDTGTVYPVNKKVSGEFRFISSVESFKKTEFNSISLDEFFSDDTTKPDVIKINVDGAEGDVLKGADKILDSVVLCIVEVNMTEFFSGIDLFYDVAKYMAGKGFILYDIKDVVRDYRMNDIYHFEDTQPLHQDYYYFKSDIADVNKLLKASSLAEIFNYRNLACWMLENAMKRFCDKDKEIIEQIYNKAASAYKEKYIK